MKYLKINQYKLYYFSKGGKIRRTCFSRFLSQVELSGDSHAQLFLLKASHNFNIEHLLN